MIQLAGAGKRFGHKLLFEDVDWLITTKDHIGLVGGNGTGKSTILKVLGDMEHLDYGQRNATKGMSAGYLPQDGLSLTGRTVFQECMSVFADLKDMEKEAEVLSHSLADMDPASQEYNSASERLHRIDSEFRTRDGYALDAHVGTVLSGLSFAKEDWSRPTEEFSGGWQMRIALAKLLLEKPNLLLLDEPTNHLDLEARNWLEGYLTTYPNAFVLISHDRYFLDVTVNRIVEIWNKRIHFYPGNYEKYIQQKTERREQLEAAARNQRERIEQLEAFINRFRYQATKAKQVQSRIKELDKIERIELPAEEKTIHFSFPQPKPSGRIVAEFRGVSKSYGDKHVLSDVNFVIERGDRIALVGVNGAGKSTLIKLLSGAESLTSGEYKLGHNVEPDYFAQDQYKELNPDNTLLEDISEVSQKTTQTELRNILGCFLFSEDDVFKRIGVLSGGERNRYALAKMLLHPSNFVLLDEPTNHLDLRAKEVLLTSLQEYNGTVVFVSHDRYFLDKLATRVFEVAGGQVNIFPGNYEEYLWRKAGGFAEGALVLPDLPGAETVPGNANRNLAAADAGKKRLNPMKVKQLQDRCAEIEREVERVEGKIAEGEAALGVFVNAEETQRVSDELARLRSLVDTLTAEWEEISAALESQ
ncbi:MAG: ribosomal protection-like ABC-F family protein [Bryobacteraceae bacterium]